MFKELNKIYTPIPVKMEDTKKTMTLSFRTVRNIGLGSLLLIIIIISCFSYSVTLTTIDTLKTVTETKETELNKWNELWNTISHSKDTFYGLLVSKKELISPTIISLNRSLEVTEKMNKITKEKTIIEKLQKELMTIRQAVLAYQVEIKDGHQDSASAQKLEDIYLESFERIYSLNHQAIELVHYRIKKDNQVLIDNALFYKKILSGLLTFTFFITVIIAFTMGKALSKPINQLVKAITSIAHGDLKTRLEVNRNDEIGCLFKAFNDITEKLRNSRQALIEANNYTQSIIKNMSDIFIVVNNEGAIEKTNKRALTILGYKEEELIDTSIKTLFMEKPEQVEELLKNVGINGSVQSVEKIFSTKNGQEIPVLFSGSVLSDENEGVSSIICMAQEISERKKAEEELRKAKEKAEMANMAKSEFLANMSHEIRTPMNAIIGMTELVLDTNLSLVQKDYLETVKRSSEFLMKVLNDILDYSKIEAGKLDLDPINFNLRDSVGDTLKTLAYRAGEKGLELAYYVKPDVPNAVIGDPSRLRQIIVNLVGNAIKFTKEGEIVVIVEKKGEAEDTLTLHFSISDTGVGITQDKLSSVFDNFTQADSTTTRQYGGTGLGLSISKKLIEIMGGRIWVESAEGQGSIFQFTIPFSMQTDEAVTNNLSKPSSLRDTPVLLVEDNATTMRILKDMLDGWQMKAHVAENAYTALSELTKAEKTKKLFKVILLDAHLPDMTGYDLVKIIRENHNTKDLIIMMLTSSGRRGDAVKCRELGINVYLTKPVKQSDLCDAFLMALSPKKTKNNQSHLITRHLIREKRKSLHILCVEDNLVNMKLLLHLLKRMGHTAEPAYNGTHALKALDSLDFDLILMDIQMPQMDGLETTAAIRERETETGTHIPIIAITAHAMQGDKERCINAGMDAYISKPINSEELVQIIEKCTTPDEELITSADGISNRVFNREAVLSRLNHDTDLLHELVGLFIQDTPLRLKEIKEAIENHKTEEIQIEAHTLKGAAANIGADLLKEAAFQLECAGKSQSISNARNLLERLEQEFVRFVESN